MYISSLMRVAAAPLARPWDAAPPLPHGGIPDRLDAVAERNALSGQDLMAATADVLSAVRDRLGTLTFGSTQDEVDATVGFVSDALSSARWAGRTLFSGTPGTAKPFQPYVPAVAAVPATSASLTVSSAFAAVDTSVSGTALNLVVDGTSRALTLPDGVYSSIGALATGMAAAVLAVGDPAFVPGSVAVSSDAGRLRIATGTVGAGGSVTLGAPTALSAALGLDGATASPGSDFVPGVAEIPERPATPNDPLSFTFRVGQQGAMEITAKVSTTSVALLGLEDLDVAADGFQSAVGSALGRLDTELASLAASRQALGHAANLSPEGPAAPTAEMAAAVAHRANVDVRSVAAYTMLSRAKSVTQERFSLLL